MPHRFDSRAMPTGIAQALAEPPP